MLFADSPLVRLSQRRRPTKRPASRVSLGYNYCTRYRGKSILAYLGEVLADSLCERGIVHSCTLPKGHFGLCAGADVAEHSYHFTHTVPVTQVLYSGQRF